MIRIPMPTERYLQMWYHVIIDAQVMVFQTNATQYQRMPKNTKCESKETDRFQSGYDYLTSFRLFAKINYKKIYLSYLKKKQLMLIV